MRRAATVVARLAFALLGALVLWIIVTTPAAAQAVTGAVRLQTDTMRVLVGDTIRIAPAAIDAAGRTFTRARWHYEVSASLAGATSFRGDTLVVVPRQAGRSWVTVTWLRSDGQRPQRTLRFLVLDPAGGLPQDSTPPAPPPGRIVAWSVTLDPPPGDTTLVEGDTLRARVVGARVTVERADGTRETRAATDAELRGAGFSWVHSGLGERFHADPDGLAVTFRATQASTKWPTTHLSLMREGLVLGRYVITTLAATAPNPPEEPTEPEEPEEPAEPIEPALPGGSSWHAAAAQLVARTTADHAAVDRLAALAGGCTRILPAAQLQRAVADTLIFEPGSASYCLPNAFVAVLDGWPLAGAPGRRVWPRQVPADTLTLPHE